MNASFEYLIEPEPRGTGGAIAYAIKELSISDSLVLENIHTNELYNWLEYVKNDI